MVITLKIHFVTRLVISTKIDFKGMFPTLKIDMNRGVRKDITNNLKNAFKKTQDWKHLLVFKSLEIIGEIVF